MTLNLPKGELLDLIDSPVGKGPVDYVHIDSSIIGTSRWSIKYRTAFFYKGDIYVVDWSTGATEMQDEMPFEYDGDEIAVYPAVAKETVTYERAPA